jgi:hypothetical protein
MYYGHELKKGDIVIAKRNNGYGITKNGWKGVVTCDGFRTDYFEARGVIDGRTFDDLDINKFDIIYCKD